MQDRTKNIATIVLAVLLIIGVPAVATHLTNTVDVSNGVTVQSPDGMAVTIDGTTKVDMRNMFTASDTVELTTEDGNITFTSPGQANATIHKDDITGTWTNISKVDAASNNITLDPEDKEAATVSGDTGLFRYGNTSVNDNSVDFLFKDTTAGGANETTVTILDAPANSDLVAWDTTYDTVLAAGTSDANGNVTFKNMPSVDTSGGTSPITTERRVAVHTVEHTPNISNPSPTGQVTSSQDTISVDVSDADFPEDNVTVTITLEGTQIHSETITSNSTVTTSNFTANELGKTYNYDVTATDTASNSQTKSYSFTLPDKLYIFNETPPHNLLNGTNVSVSATITGSNETAIQRTVSNGKINLTGLPADESYIITLETDDYYTREVYIASIYDQQSVFLLNTSQASVQNSLSVDDRTGKYSDNPVIAVDRVINTSNISQIPDEGYKWTTIGGDRLGASGVYVIDLEKDSRYRFRVINTDGDTRVLGEYTAKSAGDIVLEIGSIDYDLTGEDNAYEWNSYIENESGGPTLTFAYNDPGNLTDNVTLTVRYRENDTVLLQEDFTNGPYGEIVYTEPLTQNQYENHSFVVDWSAGRDGETITGKTYVGSRQGITLPLDRVWMQIGYAALIFVFAFLVGAGVNAAAGSLVVITFAGFGWYIEIVPPELGAGAVILGLMVASIQHMLSSNTPQRVR